MNAREVVKIITQAFDGVSREDGVTIHEARVLDDYGGKAERAQARELDTEVRWQDIPASDIERLGDTLSFFDHKGFRYYLPAFMCWAIINCNISDSIATDFTVFSLDPGKLTDELYKWNLDRYQAFMPNERKAIREFLRYMYTQEDCHTGSYRGAVSFWESFADQA